ncbi:hypothetical protein FA15DRAFT_548866, partial [Coprinopsis marcescibilis]
TCPDNVFVSEVYIDKLVQCKVLDNTVPKADHSPIAMELDVSVDHWEEKPKPDFRATDWERFGKQLRKELKGLGEPRELRTTGELERVVERLEEVMMKVIKEVVPVRRPGGGQKIWWSKELGERRKEMRRMAEKAKQWRYTPAHPIH